MRITSLQTETGDTVEVGVTALRGGDPNTYRLRLPGREVEVQYECASDGTAAGWIVLDGQRHRFQVAHSGARLAVWVDGCVRNYEVLERTARRRRAAAEVGSSAVLLAPMPGTILRIDVEAGRPFEAHHPLIIMESMKMEMTLSVPHAGVVKQVLCESEQLVERGAELILFEEPNESGEAAS